MSQGMKMRGGAFGTCLVALATLALSGCAQTVAPLPTHTGAVAAEAADAKIVEQPSAPLPRPKKKPPLLAGVPVSQPEQLMGLGGSQVVAILGSPALQEQADPAQVWIYNAKSCVLRIFLYPEINTQEFRALAYEMLNTPETESDRKRCLREVTDANAG